MRVPWRACFRSERGTHSPSDSPRTDSSPSLENVSAALGLPAGTVARALLVVLGRTLPQASDLCRPPFGLKWGIKPSPLPILYASSAITPTCGQTAYQEDVVH